MHLLRANRHLLLKVDPMTQPDIGMGATEIGWTDRRPYTVIAIDESGKRCTVQEDTATRTDDNGMSDVQEYHYEANPQGMTRILSLRADGRWREVGGTTIFHIGTRRKYHDYGF